MSGALYLGGVMTGFLLFTQKFQTIEKGEHGMQIFCECSLRKDEMEQEISLKWQHFMIYDQCERVPIIIIPEVLIKRSGTACV